MISKTSQFVSKSGMSVNYGIYKTINLNFLKLKSDLKSIQTIQILVKQLKEQFS